MQQKTESSPFALESPAAAKLLQNQRALRLLGAFFAGSESLSSAARRIDMPLPTALRLAKRLVEVGAVKIVREVERAGRPIKLYRAVARVLFVPYDAEQGALPDEIVRRLVDMRIDEQVRGLTTAARGALSGPRAQRWGTLIYADRHGSLVVRPEFETGRTPSLLAGDSPAYLNFYSDNLRLTAAQAKQLQRDLVALLKRYKSIQDGARTFTLSAVLAPRVSRNGRDARSTRV